ncbi:hypothetical protein C8Q77DRAFT_1220246 [Trametes polyzona]|nr:hypothetical protein C8Q77DRAFT_1220246 [Trametes polyzona]
MSFTSSTLPPLIIPSATHPLKVFPPPAPTTVRRPLRERCGVNLTLHIDNPALAFKSSKVPGPWSPKGHLQPHRNHLPRRRNPKPCFAGIQEKQPVAAAALPVEPTKPAPIPTPDAVSAPSIPSRTPSYAFDPPKSSEPQLQAIIPALWVAFAQPDDRSYEDGFSHIVEISYGSAPTSDRRWDGRAHRLQLILPESSRRPAGRAALALTDAQLREARDFIAECLPQSIASLPEQNEVRVLVATPPGRPTDAMALVGCYLAFVAEQTTETILRCVDEEESVLSVWKGEVSGDETVRVDRIARSWSWLSAVAKR